MFARSMLRSARPAAARASTTVARRGITQNSLEAQRYSFTFAAEEIAAAPTTQAKVALLKGHVNEVRLRLQHGWFRDGVTHPNSNTPPDGLPRMTWTEQHVAKMDISNPGTYTPVQFVTLTLGIFFGGIVAPAVLYSGSSSAAREAQALADKDAQEK